MARLTPEQWQSIRIVWEYDPDEPSFDVAAARAAKKYDFSAPRRQSVHERAKRECWQRRGSLNGINAAAQRRADRQMSAAHVPQPEGLPDAIPPAPDSASPPAPDGVRSPSPAAYAVAAREADIDKRADTNKRHRQEWVNVAVLRNEAVSLRVTDPVRCSERLRQVKIMAEITAIQQAGERKAWGLDVPFNAGDLENLSDEALAAIAGGRAP
ncbi:MAG: hypothetical protein JWQ07_4038 [Ramlibacter sp.]|nr:hypothetical protein [Ramlibacter sp.]